MTDLVKVAPDIRTLHIRCLNAIFNKIHDTKTITKLMRGDNSSVQINQRVCMKFEKNDDVNGKFFNQVQLFAGRNGMATGDVVVIVYIDAISPIVIATSQVIDLASIGSGANLLTFTFDKIQSLKKNERIGIEIINSSTDGQHLDLFLHNVAYTDFQMQDSNGASGNWTNIIQGFVLLVSSNSLVYDHKNDTINATEQTLRGQAHVLDAAQTRGLKVTTASKVDNKCFRTVTVTARFISGTGNLIARIYDDSNDATKILHSSDKIDITTLVSAAGGGPVQFTFPVVITMKVNEKLGYEVIDDASNAVVNIIQGTPTQESGFTDQITDKSKVWGDSGLTVTILLSWDDIE